MWLNMVSSSLHGADYDTRRSHRSVHTVVCMWRESASPSWFLKNADVTKVCEDARGPREVLFVEGTVSPKTDGWCFSGGEAGGLAVHCVGSGGADEMKYHSDRHLAGLGSAQGLPTARRTHRHGLSRLDGVPASGARDRPQLRLRADQLPSPKSLNTDIACESRGFLLVCKILVGF